jgi:hypothetical protein
VKQRRRGEEGRRSELMCLGMELGAGIDNVDGSDVRFCYSFRSCWKISCLMTMEVIRLYGFVLEQG